MKAKTINVFAAIVVLLIFFGCTQSRNDEIINDKNGELFNGNNPDGALIIGKDKNNNEALGNNTGNNQSDNNLPKDQELGEPSVESGSNENLTDSYPGYSTVNALPDCKKTEVFTVSPISPNSYTRIAPLGHVSPPGHTVPTDHVYMILKMDGTKSAVTDVFAPGDITIYEVKKTQALDEQGNVINEDYGVYFAPCKQIRAWYGHMALSDELKAKISSNECRDMGSPPGMKQCNYIVNYKISAGEYMGTTGGGGSAALDLGVLDSRIKLSGFANPARHRSEYLTAKCPIDYFTEPVKSTMRNFLGWESQKRIIEPICGELMQDIPGTAQGVWFDGPISNQNLENEGKIISLVHDNMLGILGRLVIGGQVSEAGIIEFNPTHTGTKNREPSEVTPDGKIYCYQNGDTQYPHMGLAGKAIIQLVDANTLKIEHQEGNCGGSETLKNPLTYTR